MKRRALRNRTLVALIVLLALLSVSCNLVSGLTGKARETAAAAVETAQAVAKEAAATPASQSADAPTSTPHAASSQPEPTATSAPVAEGGAVAEGSSGPVEMDGLENLQSYRADWTTQVEAPNQERMVIQYRLEWTAEPPAQHVWADSGMSSFAEVIWIEDKVWVKAGDTWIVGGGEDATQAFDNFHNAFETDDNMTLVGQETVNGVRSQHYVYDFESTMQGARIHRDIWVADQAGLPRVPVRALLRMETKTTEGTLITQIEANLYDINTPIEIKPPM